MVFITYRNFNSTCNVSYRWVKSFSVIKKFSSVNSSTTGGKAIISDSGKRYSTAYSAVLKTLFRDILNTYEMNEISENLTNPPSVLFLGQ
ncbi:hypothetical protein NPIL_8281 [Nephila pilipes]|uniref:Uncharacterized protein n=1 Tax=Nephila pilipes TaxID=299642 RepID=A0A8X6JWC0_NEPPI|nr:hypothetical protein NPIL_8281 [Nephila pilipes]